jgi:HlyD family secretion protein
MKNLLIGLLVVAALVAGGVFGWKKFGPQTQAASSAGQRTTTAVAEKRDLKFLVNVAGEIGPAEQVSVRPEVNGKIDSLPVDVGDAVKKDQVLFTLDDKDLQTERSQRVTEIEGAKLSLKGA